MWKMVLFSKGWRSSVESKFWLSICLRRARQHQLDNNLTMVHLTLIGVKYGQNSKHLRSSLRAKAFHCWSLLIRRILVATHSWFKWQNIRGYHWINFRSYQKPPRSWSITRKTEFFPQEVFRLLWFKLTAWRAPLDSAAETPLLKGSRGSIPTRPPRRCVRLKAFIMKQAL